MSYPSFSDNFTVQLIGKPSSFMMDTIVKAAPLVLQEEEYAAGEVDKGLPEIIIKKEPVLVRTSNAVQFSWPYLIDTYTNRIVIAEEGIKFYWMPFYFKEEKDNRTIKPYGILPPPDSVGIEFIATLATLGWLWLQRNEARLHNSIMHQIDPESMIYLLPKACQLTNTFSETHIFYVDKNGNVNHEPIFKE